VQKRRGYIPTYEKVENGHHIHGHYMIMETVTYYSPRYNRRVTVSKLTVRDGASGAFDIRSLSWWVHDELCDLGCWDDKTPVTNWQASCVLSDILHDEGRWFRARTWLIATYLFGCKNARKQGMFRRKSAPPTKGEEP